MPFTHALNEWSHRRYWPLTHWYQQRVPNCITSYGDTALPDKGVWTGWRCKWSWSVAKVELGEVAAGQRFRYWPGYSLNDGHTFRRTVRPVTTTCFAFLVGAAPVTFAVFGAQGERIDAQLQLLAADLTWGQVVTRCAGRENVTFV